MSSFASPATNEPPANAKPLFLQIHNATVAAAINSTGNSTLSIVRDLASFHEYGSFTDVSPSGIGNVAGRSFLSLVLPSLNTIATETAPVKVAQFQVAYKPFLSLFNLTNIAGSGLFPNPYVCVFSFLSFSFLVWC